MPPNAQSAQIECEGNTGTSRTRFKSLSLVLEVIALLPHANSPPWLMLGLISKVAVVLIGQLFLIEHADFLKVFHLVLSCEHSDR